MEREQAIFARRRWLRKSRAADELTGALGACESHSVIVRSALLSALLPEHVVAYEASGCLADAASLHLGEISQVAQACEKRRLEFATGRACARAALAQLGFSRGPLYIGPDRAPVWPASVVGSITHTNGYCAAAVSIREHCLSIGIDAETCGQIRRIDWPQLFTPEEMSWLRGQSPHSEARFATSIFSAKEAFFKCQFVVTGEWLDFTDVSVHLDAASYEVRPRHRLLVERVSPTPFRGTHGQVDDRVVTAIVMARG